MVTKMLLNLDKLQNTSSIISEGSRYEGHRERNRLWIRTLGRNYSHSYFFFFSRMPPVFFSVLSSFSTLPIHVPFPIFFSLTQTSTHKIFLSLLSRPELHGQLKILWRNFILFDFFLAELWNPTYIFLLS